jgi:HK97 family phage major capsid protein
MSEATQAQWSAAQLEEAIVRAVTAGLQPLVEELRRDPLRPGQRTRGVFDGPAPGVRLGRDLSRLKPEEMTETERHSEFIRAIYRRDQDRVIALGGYPADAYYRQMGEASGAAGGFLVPADFRAAVILKMEKVPHIWQRAFRVSVGSDRLEVPTEAGSVTWNWTAESATITASTPTLGQVVFAINTLAGLTKSSRQLLADSRVNIGDLITTLFGRELGKELDKQFMGGDGSGKPLGIRNGGVTQTVAQAGANLAYGDIVELWHKLPSQYRAGAVWMMEDSRIKLVEKLLDADNRPIFVAPGRALESIYGKPVLEQQDIPTNLGGGSNESEIWLADLGYYWIADREEMGVELSTEAGTAFESHQAWWKLWTRLDGRITLKDAFATLTGVK